MSALPSISVVIPCFNAERYIGTTLRSVLAQDWPDLQVIVVDDGSRDASVEAAARAHPGARIVTQANAGVAAARNHGIRLATGELVAFVDADDVWLPGKLHAQWEALRADGEARMAYAAWHVWESAEPEPTPTLLDELARTAGDAGGRVGPTGWIYPELLLDCEVWTSTVLAYRSLFAEIGVFDESLRVGEDYDLWLRASRVTRILRLPRPLALYRMHPQSITKKAHDRNFQAEVVERAMARWGLAAPDGRKADAASVDRALARTWRNHAAAHLAAGSRPVARAAAARALRLEPTHWGAMKMLLRSLL